MATIRHINYTVGEGSGFLGKEDGQDYSLLSYEVKLPKIEGGGATSILTIKGAGEIQSIHSFMFSDKDIGGGDLIFNAPHYLSISKDKKSIELTPATMAPIESGSTAFVVLEVGS